MAIFRTTITFGPGYTTEVYVDRDPTGQVVAMVDPTQLPPGVGAREIEALLQQRLAADAYAEQAAALAWQAYAGYAQAFNAMAPGGGGPGVDFDARRAPRLDAQGTFRVGVDRLGGQDVPAHARPPAHASYPGGAEPREPGRPAAAIEPDRQRGEGSGVVRLELLGQIRGALAETLAAHSELVDRTSADDRKDTAEGLASAVLQTLGVELPSSAWVPHTREAQTWGGTLRLGNELAERLPLPALTQLLLHQAGRVHDRRDQPAAEHLLRALHAEGYLDDAAFRRLAASDERASDVYAALGTWMFAPAQRASIAQTLAAIERPDAAAPIDGAERAEHVRILVAALDRASADGAFAQRLARHDGHLDDLARARERTPWAFGDG